MKPEAKTSSILYHEEPIATDSEDRFERTVYASVIAETIASSEGAFNFGISGDWGMGKSSVLRLLEPRLREKGFLVVWFNPWKIAGEIVSIRRKFLMDLVSGLSKQKIKVELPENLEKATVRILEPGFKKKVRGIFRALWNFVVWFAVISLLPVVLLLILSFLLPEVRPQLEIALGWYGNVLVVPAIIALFPTVREYVGSLSLQQVNPEMETALQFEDQFERILSKARSQRGEALNLAVFIDDLDRCPPRDMMKIFSSIMTFFERRGITFVISADQKMVEKIIQKELGGDPADAREFVKKILQVNWVMPAIPYHLQREFVEASLPSAVAPPEKVKEKLSRGWIVDMVRREFGGNPRKVRYFMRELEFQVRAVEAKVRKLEGSKGPNEEELANLRNIRSHPELLAKVLIIRSSDKFAEFWSKIQQEPHLILREETGDAHLPEPLKTFLETQPLFSHGEQNPQYYVFFSGITGFEEIVQAADPSFFLEYSKNGDLEKAKAVIRGASDVYRVGHLDKLLSAVLSAAEPQQKVNYTRSFSQNIALLEDSQNRGRLTLRFLDVLRRVVQQQSFLNQLQDADFAGLVLGLTNEPSSIAEATRILTESPFSNTDVRRQVYFGFAISSGSLATGVLDAYSHRLSEELTSRDNTRENFALELLRTINGNLSRSPSGGLVLDGLIGVTQGRNLPSDPLCFQALVQCAGALSETQKEAVTSYLQRFIDGSIHDLLFFVQNLPDYVKITTKDGTRRLVESFRRRNLSEKGQILSAVRSHPSAISEDARSQVLESLIEHTRSQSADEALTALAYLRESSSLVPANPGGRQKAVRLLVERVSDDQCQVRREILSLLGEWKEFWSGDKDIANELMGKLRVWSENALLSEAARALLVELQGIKAQAI